MWIRTPLAIVVGLVVISVIVEPLEAGLVILLNEGTVPAPERYLEIRNQSWFLILKFAYNFAAAAVGGYLAARIAGRWPLLHAATLAALQSLLFFWAISRPEMRAFAPDWAWAGFVIATATGVLAGAALQARQITR